MLYTTILVATDGFEHSDRALQHGAHVAHETGAKLHVVSVIPTPRVAELFGGEYLHLTPQERERRIREQLVGLISALGVQVSLHVVHSNGAVAPQIADAADELDADVIVVGGHGRAPLPAALLGSVAQALPHITARPILVVPGAEPQTGIVRRLRGDHTAAADGSPQAQARHR